MRASVRQNYGDGSSFPGNQGLGDLDLRRDQRLVGAPSEPGYYSKQEHTYNEGDTTKRVVEEVTKEKVGGTTVTRVVKHETTNRQTPMQQTIQFGQPFASQYDDGSPRFQGASHSSTGPLRVQYDFPAKNAQGSGSSTATYDFPAMIEDLERCTTWDSSVHPSGSNPQSTRGGGGSTWSSPGSTADWTNGTQNVEVQPGGRIQIQFQPGSSRFAAEPKYEIQRFVQEPNQPLRQETSESYGPSAGGQYGTGQGTGGYGAGAGQYGGVSGQGVTRQQSQQYPYSGPGAGGGIEMPVIHVESSNDHRPHVEFSIQPNVRAQSSVAVAGGPGGASYSQPSGLSRSGVPPRGPGGSQEDDGSYQTDVYETTQTRRIVTEQDHPVVVRQTSSSTASNAPWQTGGGSKKLGGQWGAQSRNDANNDDVITRNESGSLTRSLSSSGPQQQRGGASPQSRPITLRQSSTNQQGGNQGQNGGNYPGNQYSATAAEVEQDNSNYPRVYPVPAPDKLPWETTANEGGDGYRQNSPRVISEAVSPRGGGFASGGQGSGGVRNQSQHPLQGYQPEGRVTSPQAYKSAASPLQAYEPPNTAMASQQAYGAPSQGGYQAGQHQGYQGASPSYQSNSLSQGYQGGSGGGSQGAASPRVSQQGSWQQNRPGFQKEQQAGYYGDNDSGSYPPPQSGYSTSQSGFGSPQSGYGPPQSGNGSSQSGYGPQQSGYGSPQSGYGPQQGGYAQQQGDYGPQQDGYGPQQSGYGPQQSGYGPQQSGYGPQQSGYGPQQGDYGPQQGGYGPPSGEYGGQSQNDCYGPPPPAPPMAPPPPPAPSIKNYYGPAVVPERAKVAKTVANSVLSPENSNSRGQSMFLRRQANAENWTVGGGGGGGGEEQTDYRMSSGGTNQSGSWGGPSPQRPSPQFAPPSPNAYQQGGVVTQRNKSPSPRPGSLGSLAVDTAHDASKGGALFAKRQQRAERWAAADGPGPNQGGRPQGAGAGPPQQQQQSPGVNRPMKLNVISRGPPPANQRSAPPGTAQRGFTDL